MDVERIAEINVRVTSFTSSDAERILNTARNLLKNIEGLKVTSIYLVKERLVEDSHANEPF